MKLYAHQKEIIDADPKKTGLFLGTGSGKTRVALMLARGRTLVICPKTQREDRNWEREHDTLIEKRPNKWKKATEITNLTVLSKEDFRRDYETLPKFDTIIVDEAHTCLGVTPNTRQRKRVTIPKASQLFEALDSYIAKWQPKRVYLCTATIIKSPMTVWGAAKILGRIKGDVMDSFFKFRREYYVQLPLPGREIYAPINDSKTKDALASLVRRLGYTGRLEDYFDVPEQTFKTVNISLTEKQKERLKKLPMEFPDPIVLLGKKLQVENGVLSGDEYNAPEFFENEKIEKILEYAEEFQKIVVFVKYTAQIDAIRTALEKSHYIVREMTGRTKYRGLVIQRVNEDPACIFIVQAQISAGWQLGKTDKHLDYIDTNCMIFASRTYSYVDYIQGIGRILRSDNLKKNLYINLVVKGGVDEAVDRSLTNKQDFDERIYLKI